MRHTAHMFSLTMLLIPVGLVAGVLAGLFGIGGGLVIVPIVTLLLIEQGMSAEWALPTAIATSLGSMLITAPGAVHSHAKKMPIDFGTLLRLAPGVMLGGVLGAWLATELPVMWLGIVFAVLVSLIGLHLLAGLAPKPSNRFPQVRGTWWTGPLIGTTSALMGIGGGSLVVPYLIWNGFRSVQAVAIASATGWLLALSGTVGFLLAEPRYLDATNILVIGVCGLVATPVGVGLAHRLSSARLGRLFGLLLIVVAFRMLWQIHNPT